MRLQILSLLLLTGCASQPRHTLVEADQRDSQPLLSLSTISIETPTTQLLPGPGGKPIKITINEPHLKLLMRSSSYLYYCAPDNTARAEQPLKGSIISRGDCVGVRINKETGQKQWIVDNKNYSGMASLWVKDFEE